jgi:transposase
MATINPEGFFRRLSKTEQILLVNTVLEGMSVRSASRVFDVTPMTVCYWMRKAGVVARKQNRSANRQPANAQASVSK